MIKRSFKKGERCIYREDDWLAEVEVVRNITNQHQWAYTLKVICTLFASRVYKPIPDGEIFKCGHSKKYPNYPFMWDLKEKNVKPIVKKEA